MNPTLKDCEVVLVDREVRQVDIGDIVVVKHPIEQKSEIIKRVQQIDGYGHFFIVGDNPDDSNDSRSFGAVKREYIKGKVIARLG